MSTVRDSAFGGRFYPAVRTECERALADLLEPQSDPPSIACIVPHAGWVYSGRLAARGLASIARSDPDTVVIFGAMHTRDRNVGSVYAAEGVWQTPMGTIGVDDELAAAIVSGSRAVAAVEAHRDEHSIEVQLPILHKLRPDARIVPISVRPGPDAAAIGAACANASKSLGRRVAFIGSTDLTHYGPAYGLANHGVGRAGNEWARDINDRRVLALIQGLDADGVIAEAAKHHNACGAGAVAATIAAAQVYGATRFVLLEHTCSSEVAGDPDAQNSVGYATGIFV